MKVHLYGGFGEKGRTCVGIDSGSVRVLLDAGLKTDGGRDSTYPILSSGELREITAIVISHAHEDHAGALGWCLANGFMGEVWMTCETAHDLETACSDYLEPAHQELLSQMRRREFDSGQLLRFGDLTVTSGRSGHTVGGVWLAVTQRGKTLLYCADVVPQSPLLVMDALPTCAVALIDASYGNDPVPMAVRARQIADWTEANSGVCLLPTPLIGRSLELFLAVPPPLSVHADMVPILQEQMEHTFWFQPDAEQLLRRRLATANHWRDGDPWPRRPLICYDGMGLTGPSVQLISRAQTDNVPILMTGHLPEGSLGEHAADTGAAEIIRLPTHPTRDENIAMVRACRADRVIGHSCPNAGLRELQQHLPAPLEFVQTGDHLHI